MINRRDLIRALGLLSISAPLCRSFADGMAPSLIQKPIPSSEELLPVIGVGTSRTFDQLSSEENLSQYIPVLEAFFNRGGRLIDSSPMYGDAEQFSGDLMRAMAVRPAPFIATKVWTVGKQSGVDQMKRSFERLGVETIDLMQIHNLKDWEVHLKTLREMKERGAIRYIGITTSHGRDHSDLEAALKKEDFDFVQLSYSIANRTVEKRLLPLAQDKAVAVIANRNFQRGQLFSVVKGKPLPAVAKEIGCTSWAQLFLKYTVSHPAVNCAIPATKRLEYMIDNMQAGRGVLPDLEQRRAIEQWFGRL